MLTLKKILCPTDFSQRSKEAVRFGSELALATGAELCLVHVVPVVPPQPMDPHFSFSVPEFERVLHENAFKSLNKIASGLKAKGVEVRPIIGHGDAAGEIVRIAELEGADLIVIATHGKTGWRRLAFGSVTEKVVRLANRSVLTVRGASEETGEGEFTKEKQIA